jgi:hypothetical protein
MNPDQIASLVRSVLKMAGAALAVHGLTNAANIVNGEDLSGVVITILGLVLSHFSHSDGTTPSTPSGASKVSVLLVFGMLAGTALFNSGCANTTPNNVAYNTVAATSVTVDVAMDAWGAYVASGHATIDQERQVKAAYEKYQAAVYVVIDAGEVFAGATTNTIVTLSSALTTAQANQSQDLSDLVNLITSFGVKL